MKVRENSDQMADEICNILNIRRKIEKQYLDCITKIEDYGILILSDYDDNRQPTSKHEIPVKIMGYFIMPNYDTTLNDYLKNLSGETRIEKILDMGCQLIRIVEAIHKSGYVYNNFSPENVMMTKEKASLIDFG